MKNLTEIAEVLDRGGVLEAWKGRHVRQQVRMECGRIYISERVNKERWVIVEDWPFKNPDDWNEYHEPPPPPPEPTVAELITIIRTARAIITSPMAMFAGAEAILDHGLPGAFIRECDRLGIK